MEGLCLGERATFRHPIIPKGRAGKVQGLPVCLKPATLAKGASVLPIEERPANAEKGTILDRDEQSDSRILFRGCTMKHNTCDNWICPRRQQGIPEKLDSALTKRLSRTGQRPVLRLHSASEDLEWFTECLFRRNIWPIGL